MAKKLTADEDVDRYDGTDDFDDLDDTANDDILDDDFDDDLDDDLTTEDDALDDEYDDFDDFNEDDDFDDLDDEDDYSDDDFDDEDDTADTLDNQDSLLDVYDDEDIDDDLDTDDLDDWEDYDDDLDTDDLDDELDDDLDDDLDEDWDDQDSDEDAGDTADVDDAASKTIKALRKENAQRRQQNRELREQSVSAVEAAIADFTTEVATGLGVETGDGLDTSALVTSVSEQMAALAEERNQAQRELAVFRASVTAGADISKLNDSRAFAKRLKALDPADDDFKANVAKLVAKAVDKNPDFKAAPQVDRSGGDFTGGTASTPDDSIEALAAKRRKRQGL